MRQYARTLNSEQSALCSNCFTTAVATELVANSGRRSAVHVVRKYRSNPTYDRPSRRRGRLTITRGIKQTAGLQACATSGGEGPFHPLRREGCFADACAGRVENRVADGTGDHGNRGFAGAVGGRAG